MKCPMCGSSAVFVTVEARLEWNSVTKHWVSVNEPFEVGEDSTVECECGWDGEVSELEASG